MATTFTVDGETIASKAFWSEPIAALVVRFALGADLPLPWPGFGRLFGLRR